MLHIKFDQDWPTGLRDIQVRKCKIFVIQGQVTPKWVVWSGPKSNSSLVYYKLTLWAFGSGELKTGYYQADMDGMGSL